MTFVSSAYQNLIIERPWLPYLVFSLACVIALFFAQNFKVDASADSLVLEGDEDLEFYREVVERFGSSEFLLVAYELVDPLTSDKSLKALDDLADDLSAIEGVDNVVSLLDVPLLYSPKVPLSALSKGLKTLRDPSVDRNLVEKELIDSPVYRQLLSSLDESTTALQVNIKPDLQFRNLLEKREVLRKQKLLGELDRQGLVRLKEAEKKFKNYVPVAAERQSILVEQVRAVIAEHRGQARNIFLGGVPMIANDMIAFVMSDLQIFGAGIVVFILVLLTIIFREVRWVILPLISCAVTVVMMFGVLGFFDWRMTVISSNFVAILLIITLAITVHLLVRYREMEGRSPDATPKLLAMATVNAMLRPCVYTVLTTGIAFSSLVISGIKPVIDFGWMMTVGVLVALLVTFFLVPAGMATGIGTRTQSVESSVVDKDPFTVKFAEFTDRYGRWVLVFASVLAIAAIIGVSRLKVENRFIDYFDRSTEIYQGMELIDSQLGGTIPLEVILMPSALGDREFEDEFYEGGNEFEDEFAEDAVFANQESFDEFDDESDIFNDEFSDIPGNVAVNNGSPETLWFNRAALDRVERLHDHLDSLPQSGKVLSLATLYKVTRDLLGGSVDDIQLSLAKSALPKDVSDLLVDPYLHEPSGQARINVRVKETSRSLNRNEFLAQLDRTMQEDFGYAPEDYRLSGMLVLYNNMLQSLYASQILTLGAVFLAITVMLYVLFRSIPLALLAIAPNMLAALVVLGGMGWFGLPLDLMTITIAAITIGIGIDDTIHYVYRYREEIEKDRNYQAAMYRSHASIGRAMYYTSVIIIFGFSILALSNFNPSIYFGLLTGVAMLSALMGALILLPQLLIVFKPFGRSA